jgi:hypothetical protein
VYDNNCLFLSQLLNESGPSNSSMQQKKGYFLLHFVTVDENLLSGLHIGTFCSLDSGGLCV